MILPQLVSQLGLGHPYHDHPIARTVIEWAPDAKFSMQ